jgi:hypothetical protein
MPLVGWNGLATTDMGSTARATNVANNSPIELLDPKALAGTIPTGESQVDLVLVYKSVLEFCPRLIESYKCAISGRLAAIRMTEFVRKSLPMFRSSHPTAEPYGPWSHWDVVFSHPDGVTLGCGGPSFGRAK